MPLPAGGFDRLITLQTLSATREPVSQSLVETWADAVVNINAKVMEKADPMRAAGPEGVMVSAAPVRIQVRWRAIDPATTRVRYGTRLLRITGQAEIGRREGLELACEEWRHEQ